MMSNTGPNEILVHVTVLVLSWERPELLGMTLTNLRRFGSSFLGEYRIVIGDQGSTNSKVLNLLENQRAFENTTVHKFPANIGILEGFKYLLKTVETEFVLLLENDWAIAPSASRCPNIVNFMQKNSELDFVRLRSVHDLDDYGKKSPIHNPWAMPSRGSQLSLARDLKERYFVAPVSELSPTFNPTLFRKKAFASVLEKAVDDNRDKTPLRSGENSFQHAYRKTNALGSQHYPGFFYHIGFHSGGKSIRCIRLRMLKCHKFSIRGIHPYAVVRRIWDVKTVWSLLKRMRVLPQYGE